MERFFDIDLDLPIAGLSLFFSFLVLEEGSFSGLVTGREGFLDCMFLTTPFLP